LLVPINATGGTGELVTCVEGSFAGTRVLSVPAFWAASGDPASHVQRGHKRRPGGVRPRCAHADGLIPSRDSRLSALYPWSARYDNERDGTQSRKTHGAHCQTPHVPVSGVSLDSLDGTRNWPRTDVPLQITIWNEDIAASGTYGVVPFVALFGVESLRYWRIVGADQCNGWHRRTRHVR